MSAFISFHFCLLGFHFSFHFGLFPFILAFWAFISFYFGLLGLHFLSFWPFGFLFPFILAFWAFISFPCVFKKPLAQICHPSLSKMVTSSKQIQPKNCLQNWSFWPFEPSFPFILAFWAFISFHVPFILAFWAFISFHFGLLGLHFLLFWSFGPSFPFLLAFWVFHFLSFWSFGLSFPFLVFSKSPWPRFATRASPKW